MMCGYWKPLQTRFAVFLQVGHQCVARDAPPLVITKALIRVKSLDVDPTTALSPTAACSRRTDSISIR